MLIAASLYRRDKRRGVIKVLAVTGGAQGIGRAVALRFAKAGYSVSVADPVRDAGREIVETLREIGVEAIYVRTDVAKPQDVEAWMRRTVDKLGCPDVLVNNAGISRNRPFLKLPAKEFDRVIAVNLRGTFLCAQAAAKRMVARGHGGA